jgi:predicted nucleotidyltransferase
MKKQQALAILEQHRQEIVHQFAVRHLALFGSTARDEARDDSDIDVLVEFEQPATFGGYVGLLAYLEKILGRKVDLVTQGGIKPRARQHIERDMIRVA